MNNLYIPVILATGHKGRQTEKAAKFVLGEVEAFGLKTELIDVLNFAPKVTNRSKEDPKAKEFAEKIKSCDGLIIVSPEYNHSFPGELKLMLDQLYDEYNRKPAGICGVSAGRLGGARMVEQLRLVLVEFQMVPIRSAVYFSGAYELFSEDGTIKDKEAYSKRVKGFLGELVWYAKALKQAREN